MLNNQRRHSIPGEDMSKQINRVALIQPNHSILGKRSWPLLPYGLALLRASLAPRWDVEIIDFDRTLENEESIRDTLRRINPDVVGVTSFSTEYRAETHWHIARIREELPEAIIILGGAYPTVLPELAIADPNVDFCILGEGEYRLPALLECIENNGDSSALDGLAYRRDGMPLINPVVQFIQDLDAIPFPDYGNLNITDYGSLPVKYAHGLVARKYPFATTITSRGCPYRCVFCAGRTVSGRKVRMRSAGNVLRELDTYYHDFGIREVMFQDDHFLHKRDRAIKIMSGIRDRKYDFTWKCGNVAVFSLDEELLDLKKESGCYQITLSIECGVQEVLDHIIHKPVKLNMARRMVQHAKSIGLEVVSNFIIGFPGETWDQIRRTIDYAHSLDLDITNFHLATPMPKTDLMNICIEMGLLKSGDDVHGYTKGVIETDEFTAQDLMILRAYEWDRLNFATPEKICTVARMEGLSLEEVDSWRRSTRRNLGTTKESWKHTPKTNDK